MLNLTPVVKVLLLLNILVFAISALLGFDLNNLFALRYFESPYFEPYQFLSYMFAHGDFMHLFFNMFGLFMFGPMLEQHWGSSRFTIFYLVCGIGAGVVHTGISYYEVNEMRQAAEAYLSNPTPVGFSSFVRQFMPGGFGSIRDLLVAFKNNPTDPDMIAATKMAVQQLWITKVELNRMVGASGAIFGILMAFGLLFPNLELMLLFFPVPIKAKYFVLLFGAYELYSGLNRNPGDNIAHFAHLGGMLFAFILIKYWQHTSPDT